MEPTRSRGQLLPDTGLCFALGVIVAFVPWLLYRRFYFHDDMQHQHLPIYYHIGRLLREGELPFITLGAVSGGNLLGEYMYGLFNPISLLSYWILPSISNLTVAGLALACFYYGVLTSGTYVLARAFQVSRPWAWLAAVALASNNMLAYWYASTWFPVFVSISWLVWAVAFLRSAHESRLNWLMAVVFSYLTVTSGWPHTTLALGLFTCLVAWIAWRTAGALAASARAAPFAAALLLASIPLLALLSLGDLANRPTGVANFRNMLVPNLRDAIAVSSPSHLGFILTFPGYRATAAPYFYVAWFILPLTPFIKWRNLDYRHPDLIGLSLLCFLFLLSSQGPDLFFGLHFPFRWLFYMQTALLLLTSIVISQAGFVRPTFGRIASAFLVLAIQTISAVQATPALIDLHLKASIICGLGLAAFGLARSSVMRVGLLAAITLFLFFATHWVFRVNKELADWGLSDEIKPDLQPIRSPGPYTFYTGHVGDRRHPERLLEFQTGMMPRFQEQMTLNGYTSLGNKALATLLCMNVFGETCPEASARLFSVDPELGVAYADLFKVNRVIGMKGAHLKALRPFMVNGWRLENDGAYSQSFSRDLPNAAYPGTVAWITAGATAEQDGTADAERESVRIARPPGTSTKVVFSRLWWPGYTAEFDGETVPVEAHQDLFASVVIPPGTAAGELTLRFRPPHLGAGLIGTMLGLAVVAIGFLGHRRLFRGRSVLGEPDQPIRPPAPRPEPWPIR